MKIRTKRIISMVMVASVMFTVMPVKTYAEAKKEPEEQVLDEGAYSLEKTENFAETQYEMKPVETSENMQSKARVKVEIPGGVYYFDNTTGTIMGYEGNTVQNLKIPYMLDDVVVKKINNNAFKNHTELLSVEIPDNIIEVGDFAFQGCSNLSEITLSEGLKKIGNCFIKGTNISEITVPSTVESAMYAIWDEDAVEPRIDVKFAVGTKRIPDRICSGYSNNIGIKSITIPEGVTEIGRNAFDQCVKVTSIQLPSSITKIDTRAFGMCEGLTSITIPEKITTIEKETFFLCKGLESVKLNEGLVTIGANAFDSCYNLQTIEFPSTLTHVEKEAFALCHSLNSVKINEGLQELPTKVFWDCISLENITMPQSMISIGDDAFNNCRELKTITLNEGLKHLGKGFLERTRLKEITVPSTVKSAESALYMIVNYDFNTKVIFADGTTKIPANIFKKIEGAEDPNNAINSVEIPKSVKVIEPNVFIAQEVVIDDVYYKGSEAEWNQIQIGYNNEGLKNTTIHYARHEEPQFSFYGSSMVLGNNLNFEFYLNKEDLKGKTDVEALVIRHYNDGRPASSYRIPFCSWKENGNLYYIEYEGISAKEMMDEVDIIIVDKDKNQISEMYTDSIHNYAVRMLNKETTNDKLKSVLVDMLNYGAACQSYFEYNKSNLANNDISDFQQYATDKVTCNNKIIKDDSYVGTSILTKSNLQIIMYFNNLTPDMKAVVTFVNHRGNKEVVMYDKSSYDYYNGLYGVTIDLCAVADVSQPVKCEIFDINGNGIGSATDSIESYIARMSNNDPIFESLMKFGVSSHAYFHSK